MKTIKSTVNHRLSHLCLGEVLPIENLVAYVQSVHPAATRKVITDAASRLMKLGDVEKTNYYGITAYRLTDKAAAKITIAEHHRRLGRVWVVSEAYRPKFDDSVLADEPVDAVVTSVNRFTMDSIVLDDTLRLAGRRGIHSHDEDDATEYPTYKQFLASDE